MGMYKCARCGNEFDELQEGMIRCPSCAFKVIYKQRGPIVKKVQAR